MITDMASLLTFLENPDDLNNPQIFPLHFTFIWAIIPKIIRSSNMKFPKFLSKAIYVILFVQFTSIELSFSQGNDFFLKDRGTGLPTSMFGTYINQGEIIIYPFYEFYYDKNTEYKPSDFGFIGEKDYRAKSIAHEGILYFGFGITDWLALEFESAFISHSQYRAKTDISGMPSKYSEKGWGDTEGQLRWRYFKETENRPEFFSCFETVFPFQKNRKLIGTQDWELKFGSGLIKGFGCGTVTVRASMQYSAGESKFEAGEFAVEYLKKVSDFFRFYVGAEGTQDEVGVIVDLQFHFTPTMFLRVNNSFGITPKATDYAPEIGLVIYFNKK